MFVNKLKLIRKAAHVVKHNGNPEEAYTIISEAFGKEHKTEMLHYNVARSKLEADAEHYKDFLKQIEEENTGN